MKTLLIGYYGHGNLGDERLKQVCMDWIRSVDPQAEISTKKRDFFLADKVVFGGGGLFQNVTSFRSLLWYCSWAIMAWSYRKQYGLLGQGIGPVNGWVSNTLLDFVLKRADFVTVRDAVSFNRVKRVREVSHGPDMTLFTDLKDTYSKEGDVGLNLRPYAGLQRLGRDGERILHDSVDVYVSFSPEDDSFSGRLTSVDMTPYFLDSVMFPHALSGIVAMRFHACVWAAINGLPFLALVYDEKVKQLAVSLNQPWLDLRDDTVTLERLQDTITAFQASRDSLHASLLSYRDAYLRQENVHLTALRSFYEG